MTGETGFIGYHVAKRLLKSGAQVRVLAGKSEKAKELQTLGAEIVREDLLDPAGIMEAVKGCAWDFILPVPWLMSSNHGSILSRSMWERLSNWRKPP